jgi:hypothetical protein
MTARTFKQLGQGFGTEPVGIVARINGVVVFEGTTDAIDEPVPDLIDTDEDFDTVLFTWENTVNFSGTAELEITVTGPGSIVLNTTLANYVAVGNTTSGPNTYGTFYSYTEGDLTIVDPFSNPKIDGAEVIRERDFNPVMPLTGQWQYIIMAESDFTATVNITAGVEPVL